MAHTTTRHLERDRRWKRLLMEFCARYRSSSAGRILGHGRTVWALERGKKEREVVEGVVALGYFDDWYCGSGVCGVGL